MVGGGGCRESPFLATSLHLILRGSQPWPSLPAASSLLLLPSRRPEPAQGSQQATPISLLPRLPCTAAFLRLGSSTPGPSLPLSTGHELLTPGKTRLFKSGAHIAPKIILETTDGAHF